MSEVKRFGAISFSAITKAGPFYEQIWSGRKRQTMREPRNDGRQHVKPGYAFSMYWKTRLPRSKKPVHYIGLALCNGYTLVNLADVWNDRSNAERDGFIDLEEFRDWFFPGWRDLELLDEVVKAYREIGSKTVIFGMSRKWGISTIKKFLDTQYYLISWEYPLLDWGERP